jgi:hypothetical protein
MSFRFQSVVVPAILILSTNVSKLEFKSKKFTGSAIIGSSSFDS